MKEFLGTLDASPINGLQAGLNQHALDMALAEQDRVYAQWQITVSKPRPRTITVRQKNEAPRKTSSIFKTLISIF